VLARVCPGCGVLLPTGAGGRCVHCAKPQRSGSSRPEINTAAWQKLRRAARLRDGNRCVRCGAGERLSVHHAVEGSSVLDDLLTLCARCHGRVHRGRKAVQPSRFFQSEARPPRTRKEPERLRKGGAG
jgi:5-methylcytosine-specific restriction endonuclease McrA